ncbi:hypothetical protein Rhopal_002125-T1 [Rhodotorula paludigena]|uniref:LisH domain-containing protein n=1 Tax=Rhodotorula paludigena TaxID=86838 RepID=A0AAV5G9S7_9BASI|nr:hypothetical protein Rhopal_002125-T1 [Rhodotorula paludigena]
MSQHPRPPGDGGPAFAWEGDATLHSYCYDYMRKRGWNNAASHFAQEAGVDEANWTGPPIEAPQGLLYEWWSVFWDVFIARSQKSGPRNPNADAYVEAMRAKREPLAVQFAGPNPNPSMTLPRSLAHPPRPPNASYSAVGPPRANYGQMHVLEQQELQSQMQQRGRVQQLQGGLPPRSVSGPGGGYLPNPPPGQQQQQYGSPMSQPPPGNSQQQPHAPGGVQPPLMGPPHYQQPQQPPPGPPSSAGSPHMVPASHPYANGRQQGPPGAPGGSANPAFQAAMAAVGLAGRDPEMLSNEEHAAIAAQMRRMGRMVQGPPMPQRMPSDPQVRMQQGPYPHQQGMPQQRVPQLQYTQPPANAGSPASPAYTSPYSTPHLAHMQIPPQQQQQQQMHQQMHGAQSSPPHMGEFLPPPSRGPGGPVKDGRSPMGQQPGAPGQMPMQKGSPAASGPMGKRMGSAIEDPSPRTLKRRRGGPNDGGDPGTPGGGGHDMGPGSPAAGQMMPGRAPTPGQAFDGGVPYRPSPSPALMHPPPPRNPQMMPPHQQMYVTGPSPESYGGGSGSGDPMSGMNGGGMINGAGAGMVNGNLSRPASAASNHPHLSPGGPQQAHQQHISPGMPPVPEPDQRISPVPSLGGQQQQQGSLPVPPGGNDGLSRPFAGAPSASTTPLPPPPQSLPPDLGGIPVGAPPMHSSMSNGTGPGAAGDTSMQLNLSGDDMFSGLDFESFLNNDMFNEDITTT